MMRRILLVLYLSGWHIFSSCLSHQYHFVAVPMTWTEAQTYCRQTYTDLATIENSEAMQQLINTVSSSQGISDAWIGVYSNVSWWWSDGSGADYRDWGNIMPGNSTNCVMIDANSPWYPWHCSDPYPSICYKGTQQDPQFVLVQIAMTWSDAQKYCRENYLDLATVRNDQENNKLKILAAGTWPWIGLFREHVSYWSDGSNYSFSYWKETFIPSTFVSPLCGAAALTDSGKWKLSLCGTRLPFVCYSVPAPPGGEGSSVRPVSSTTTTTLVVDSSSKKSKQELSATFTPQPRGGEGSTVSPVSSTTTTTLVVDSNSKKSKQEPSATFTSQPRAVMRKVVKVRIKAGDLGSADLNNPAVKAEILRKLQERLMDKGVSGVTLKWRKQPDGKVFHKEGKQKKRRKKTEL